VYLIRECVERQDLEAARDVHDRSAAKKVPGYEGVAAAMADVYLTAGRCPDALTILDRSRAILPPVGTFNPELHQHAFVQQQAGVSVAVRIEQKIKSATSSVACSIIWPRTARCPMPTPTRLNGSRQS